MEADPSNPFHQASFYVEELKYMYGEEKVVKVIDARDQIQRLFDEAGIYNMTPDEFLNTTSQYGDSWEEVLGVDGLIARSVFTDGVMHGIAFAKGLSAPKPN